MIFEGFNVTEPVAPLGAFGGEEADRKERPGNRKERAPSVGPYQSDRKRCRQTDRSARRQRVQTGPCGGEAAGDQADQQDEGYIKRAVEEKGGGDQRSLEKPIL